MKGRRSFHSAEHVEGNIEIDFYEKYQIPDEISVAHATPDARTNDNRKNSLEDLKPFRTKTHKITLDSIFYRKSKQYKLPTQTNNNSKDYESLLNAQHKNETLRGTKVSRSRQRTGWKSRLQTIFRQSVRFGTRRDNNGNFEENWCRKTSKEEKSSSLYSNFSQKISADEKTNKIKDNVKIPLEKQLTCSDNTTRGKKSGKKTSFVKETLNSESVVGSRKSEQDKPLRKNNKLNTKRTRTKMFSQEPFTHHLRGGQLTGRELCCETRTERETLRAPFLKIWKTKSLNFIGNLFKRTELLKKEESNFVEANKPLKLHKSLSTTNTADLGFLLKRDPYLESFSSLEELSLEDSVENQYTWDFNDYIPETRDKYRSLKRSRAALIIPQNINRSFSLDDVSVRSGTKFYPLERRNMEVWRDDRRASSPYICVEFYNDDGSISPSSTSNQDIFDEDSADKESGGCDVFTPCEETTKNGASNDLRTGDAERHSHVFEYSNKIYHHRLQEQSELCKVSGSEEFCKYHFKQNDQNRLSVDGVKCATSNYLESDQHIVKTTKGSNENVEKRNKGLSTTDCFDRESDPECLAMGNHGSYNLIHPNCGHDLPTFALSENGEKKKLFYRRIEQIEGTKQSSFSGDVEIEKNAEHCGNKDLPKNKAKELESVKICANKQQIDCNKQSERASGLKRQNAISEFNMAHNVGSMKKTNIFSSTHCTDKTFHPSKVANGFPKTNRRASFDSDVSCHLKEIKGDGITNRPELQTCGLSCKQNNMALKLDLKSYHNFNDVDKKNCVPDYKNCPEDSPVSSGSSEIFVSGNNPIELQSVNHNNHLLLPSADSRPEPISSTLSPETQKSDSQVVTGGVCQKCDKIKASSTTTSPIRILKRPIPRHLSPPLVNHLSRSLPSLSSPSSRKYLQNESPIESPVVSPLSSSPESDCDKRKAVHDYVPHNISPVLQELISQGYRSSSCNKLDEAGQPSGSPPQVAPRIKSLGHLAQISTAGRKIKMTRHRGWISVPSGDNDSVSLPGMGRQHSLSTDSCNTTDDSLLESIKRQLQQNPDFKDLQEMSSLTLSSTDSETGSKVSLVSEDSTSNSHFTHPFGRSASVPGFIYGEQSSCNLSVPDDVILTKRFSLDYSLPLTDESDIDDADDEENMDAPEAFAEALWDHVTMDPEELSFSAGDIITIISWTDTDWWWGHVGDRIGWFPAPFVRVRVSQTLACEEGLPATPLRSRRGTTLGALSNRDVRARVVEEILNTEKDYVKNLKDVVEGYLRQARKRPDMFSEEQLNTVFSNVEQIYVFHKEILEKLRSFYNAADPCSSEIGSVFLENKHGFDIYSEYCNNHPHAVAQLKVMFENNKYKHFFEACRLLQEMMEISLDGFLLTPVQKICKYPLQLAELLKYTECDHKDYVPVKMALDTMKSVAATINERKRKVECINKIAKWQSSIEGWEGEDVLQRSSELIHTGEVNKISKGNCQERVFFLFDHQLIYCKKDMLKKNVLAYKGRIDMDSCNVQWLKDGEEHHNGSPLSNTWKMFNETKEKWYIVYTKKAEQRDRWMKAFQDERARVKEDANSGVVISQNTRQAAMQAVQSSIKGRKPSVKKEKLSRSFPSPGSGSNVRRSPSPVIPLPAPVSSADLKEQVHLKDKDAGGFLQRTSQLRRSFGLKGSKRSKDKEKRSSSVF